MALHTHVPNISAGVDGGTSDRIQTGANTGREDLHRRNYKFSLFFAHPWTMSNVGIIIALKRKITTFCVHFEISHIDLLQCHAISVVD